MAARNIFEEYKKRSFFKKKNSFAMASLLKVYYIV